MFQFLPHPSSGTSRLIQILRWRSLTRLKLGPGYSLPALSRRGQRGKCPHLLWLSHPLFLLFPSLFHMAVSLVDWRLFLLFPQWNSDVHYCGIRSHLNIPLGGMIHFFPHPPFFFLIILLKAFHTSLLELVKIWISSTFSFQMSIGDVFPPHPIHLWRIPMSLFENSSLAVTLEKQFIESYYIRNVLLHCTKAVKCKEPWRLKNTNDRCVSFFLFSSLLWILGGANHLMWCFWTTGKWGILKYNVVTLCHWCK